MVQREKYLAQLWQWKDRQIIKVVTGVRRCGKSTLLQQFREELQTDGIPAERIVSINFEALENEPLLEYHALYNEVKAHLKEGEKTYVFLDEVQNVPDFQKAVDALFILPEADLYITGSNAKLLSGELATLLSGRYVEIAMLPLSFTEFRQLTGQERDEAWRSYFRCGGFPFAAGLTDDAVRRDYLNGIYHTVLLKDVVQRNKVQDVALLESVIRYLFANVGSIISAKKLSDSLVSAGRKTTSATVERYLTALQECFLIYRIGRYDIAGKQYLQSLDKYYMVDHGLRGLLLTDRQSDVGHVLENIVFLELKRRGYRISIGKMGDTEVDFVAENGNGRSYFQVSASVLDGSTYAREIHPLKQIRDSYPKTILTLDDYSMDDEGIRVVNVKDWLESL